VVVARFFYLAFGALVEDPATGSACANLGGWLQLAGRAPCQIDIEQGDLVGRPSRLRHTVEAPGEVEELGAGATTPTGGIHVGGDVVDIGRGFLEIRAGVAGAASMR